MRDVYLADTPADAATLLHKAIDGCSSDEVAEVRSLGTTLASWRTEILAHHDTGASNGTTEGLILWSAHPGVVDVTDEGASAGGGRVLWSASLGSTMSRAG